MLSIIWVLLIVLSLVFGTITGNMSQVTQSVSLGAKEAITLIISLVGIICFWSGIMEILIKSRLIDKIIIVIKPFLKLLFKNASKDKKAMEYISTNFVANLLGLSNAATPMGLKAADRIYTLNQRKGTPNELIMLVVINCSSLQLLPTTVAAIRLNYGAQNTFDIIPAVWITSIISVLSGIFVAKICAKLGKGAI